jgi:hypothetical protein
MASVFFSYSHKDEALRDQLEAHLALLKNQGLIEAWHDRRIVAGDEVDDAISRTLETADIVLLLVSSDFISSPYCYSREMMRAMERHDAGEARVIPVILRHCEWHAAPFGKLMAAPRDGKPVTAWTDQDEALTDVAKQVRRAIELVGSAATKPRFPTPQAYEAGRETQAPLRSSNLRLKKNFTEKDRDDFIRSTFDFVCKFFQGSIEAVSERNADVTGTFDSIDSRRMAAILYREGKKIAQCSVRLEGMGCSSGIAFSHDTSGMTGSFNEMLNVEADDQSLYLKSMGMAWNGRRDGTHMSQEGGAEFLWELFIKAAQ